jgi:hypothetical protein
LNFSQCIASARCSMALSSLSAVNEVLRAVSVAYYRPAPQLPAASMNLFAHSQALTTAAGSAQSESSSSSAASSALDANLSTAHSKLRFGFWAPPSAAHVVEASSAFNAAAATAANAALDDADRLVFVPETARMRTLDALTSTLRKPEIWGMYFFTISWQCARLVVGGFRDLPGLEARVHCVECISCPCRCR